MSMTFVGKVRLLKETEDLWELMHEDERKFIDELYKGEGRVPPLGMIRRGVTDEMILTRFTRAYSEEDKERVEKILRGVSVRWSI